MSISSAEKKRYTYKDYAELPEGAPYRLIGGELIMVPAPTPYHQMVSGKIGDKVREFVYKYGLGEVFYAPVDVYFGEEDTFQPDIIFISNERLDMIKETRIEGAPDLVIEILSPSTAYYDLGRKYEIYERAGVKEYWIIHPEKKSVDIYDNKAAGFEIVQTGREKGMVRSELLKGYEMDLKELF